MEHIFYAVLWFLVLGGLFGSGLAFLAKKFAVKTDEREERIKALMPGANCGGCGFAGCASFAEALLRGEASPDGCGSMDAEARDEICDLLGLPRMTVEKKVAHVMCSGGCRAKEKYIYEGIRDCRIAASLAGGNKLCHNGCTGLGNCERACEYHALHVVDGVAQVEKDKCRSCGACVQACPKGLIVMVPEKAVYAVQCRSHDKAKDVMRACEVGCIGCKKCEKTCPNGAVTVTDGVAEIDQSKCTSCGLCAEACPRGCIVKL